MVYFTHSYYIQIQIMVDNTKSFMHGASFQKDQHPFHLFLQYISTKYSDYSINTATKIIYQYSSKAPKYILLSPVWKCYQK